MLRPLLLLAISLLVAAQHASDGAGTVAVDGNGDLSVTPLAGRTVLVQGVDLPATLLAVGRRLRALEIMLLIEAAGGNSAPAADSPAAKRVPWVGLDPLGNLLLVPAPSQKQKRIKRKRWKKMPGGEEAGRKIGEGAGRKRWGKKLKD